MKFLPQIYKVGCWSFILVGLGHLVTFIMVPDTAERVEVIHTMQNFSISMAGTESNLYLFYEGFSLMMGILLMGFGLLNLFLIKSLPSPSKYILFTNTFISFIALLISIKYFFLVPVVFLGIAFLSFLIAMGLTMQKKNTNV